MAKVSKSTKKFQAKHLKHTLDQRKETKKHKQLLAKHKRGKGRSSGSKQDELVEEPVKENPFDVESDSEDEKTDFGVIDKKGLASKDKKEDVSEEEESGDDEEEESKDDDIFDELDQLADANNEVDEDYPESDAEAPADDDDNDDEAPKSVKTGGDDDKIEVTLDLVKKWDTELEKKPSLKLIKNVTQAFKSAVNINEAKDGSSSMESEYKYFVTKESVFNKLLFLTLKKLPKAIHKLFPLQTKFNKEQNIQVRLVKSSEKIKQLSSVLKSHAFSLITLLSDISKTNLNLRFILLTLSSIYDVFPYLLSFRTLIKRLVGSMVGLWSSLILSSDISKNVEDDDDTLFQQESLAEKVNVDSFLDMNVLVFSVILNLSKEYSSNILETIINSCYEGFLKRSLTLPTSISLDSSETDLITYKKHKLMEFLKAGLVDLFKIDVNLSYQVAFKYIRKLSIHLRNFLKNNSNIKNENDNSKNLRLVYNWQFIQSLDLWTKLLGDVCGKTTTAGNKKPISLQELIYPVVQIAVGTMKLNAGPIYFPLKFYLFKSLTHLSAQTLTYIPLLNIYVELLESGIFNKNFTGKSNQKKGSQVIQVSSYMTTQGIKVSKNSVNTAEYQLYVINNYLYSLQKYLYLYINSLAFPEFSFIVAKKLKQFSKRHASVHRKNRNIIYFIKEVNNLVTKINENAKFVSLKRDHLSSFDPVNEPTLTSVEFSDFPLAKFLKTKQDVLDEGDKQYKELLASEQVNDASGANDRKKAQENASEEYFGSNKKKQSSKKKNQQQQEKDEDDDVDMSEDDDSSTTGSI